MPEFPKNPNPNPNPDTKLPNHHLLSPLRLHELRFKDHQFKNAVAKIHQLHFRGAVDPTRIQNGRHNDDDDDYEEEGNGIDEDDVLCRLSDATLSLILSKLPAEQWWVYSVVCKRWMFLIGRLVRSVSLLDWGFVVSGRLTARFPNLTEVSLVKCCFRRCGGNGILVSTGTVTVRVGSEFVEDGMVGMEGLLDSGTVDVGLRVLASGCPNLRKLVVVNAGVEGLGFVAKVCDMVQELELHCCNDVVLKGVSGLRNLQILKVVGSVDGLYDSLVTDIGLTILAQGCRRLVKLELSGCEGSYDGIKAIGQCCQMLEELTLTDHSMDGGWLSALRYCENLKTLRLQSCKSVDSSPGPDEHLGSCPALEELYMERCQIRDQQSVKALFLVCGAVRLIDFRDCWGLDDDMFRFASLCRGAKSLSLEGCSLLTMQGLDSVVPYWTELQLLRVASCNNVKDSEVTANMAAVFCNLKELKWRPDSRSILTSSLAGTGIGKKGGRFFKKIGAVVDRRK